MNEAGTNRWGDLMLQTLFVLALIGLIFLFYFTRISGIKAGDENVEINNGNLQTAYEFEQEQLKIEGKLRVLKVDYANDVVIYRAQINKIANSNDFSELEKKEKINVLNELYSEEYFKRKESLIDQENQKLENLKKLICQKFCTIDDLENSSVSNVQQ